MLAYMNIDYSSVNSEDLIIQYHKINSELVSEFNNHAPWNEQQIRIEKLSQISKELWKRKCLNTKPGEVCCELVLK